MCMEMYDLCMVKPFALFNRDTQVLLYSKPFWVHLEQPFPLKFLLVERKEKGK